MQIRSGRRFLYVACCLAVCGFLAGCDSALEALYGSRSRPNEEYCEHDDQCGNPSQGCDPVLHRCTAVNVCPTGAEFCLANETPVCNGAMLPCGGCEDDDLCSLRWDSGYRSPEAPELRACFRHTGEAEGRCAACAVDGRQDPRCPAATPVCSEGTCRPCAQHADCASGICRTEVAFQESPAAVLGTCVDKTLIADVADDNSLSIALKDTSRPFIKLGLGTYRAPSISQSGVFIIFGVRNTKISLTEPPDAVPQLPCIKAQGGVRLTLSQVRVSVTTAEPALSCDSQASLYVRDSVLAGQESGNLISNGIAATANCALVDIQRVYVRRMKNAITIMDGPRYNLINIGITESGVFNNPFINISKKGTFAYSTIARGVSGNIVCGAPLKYSIVENTISGVTATTCLDPADNAVLDSNSMSGWCLDPDPTQKCGVSCRSMGVNNPSLLPESDFFGNSRLTTKQPLSCGWFQP